MKKYSALKASGLSLLTLALAGCASQMQKPSQSVDHLPSDASSQYVQVDNAAKVKTHIVTRYVPVALPGQLMPVPKASDKHTTKGKGKPSSSQQFSSEKEAVQYAYKHAMVTPNSNDFFNAMATYNFMPGAMYVIYAAPMKITDIALQPGEKIISEAAGDTLRWQVSQTYSGEGANMQQHILVKPNSPNLTNTMVITTNKRVYHLVLKSTDDDTFMVSVKWTYPQDMVKFADNSQLPSDDMAGNANSPYSLNLSGMNFNYEFGMAQGDKPIWYPTRVFSDGHQTFIQLPDAAANTNNLPVLFVANDQGQYGSMVNWRLHWPYIIVDSVLRKAQLRSGVKTKDNQVIVQIQQTH